MRRRALLDGAVTQLALGVSRQVASVPGDPLDRHYTPQALADAIVERLAGRLSHHVIEPSCGGGAFVRALRAAGHGVTGCDVDGDAVGLQAANVACHRDWLTMAPAPRTYSVVGNPPFGGPPDYLGLRHALHALDYEAPLVALILPWSWLATPLPRSVLGDRLPSEVWPVAPRPWPRSVRETAVWIWGSRPWGPTVIGEPVEWRS